MAVGPRRRGLARGRHPRRGRATDATACWCREKDPRALAAALRRLLREPETRARLGDGGPQRPPCASSSWDVAARRFEEVLCPGGGAGRPLRAPATASTTRASALLLGALDLPGRAARFAGVSARAARRRRGRRRATCWCCGSTASATWSCRCPRSHDLRARAAAGARIRLAVGALERRRSRAARPSTRCSSGARPGSGRAARGRRRRSRELRAQGARAARGAARPRARPAGRRARLAAARAERRARRRGLREHRRRATCCTRRGAARRDRVVGRAEPARGRGRRPAPPARRRPFRSAHARRTASSPRACSRRSASRRRRPLVGHPPERRAAREAVGRRALGGGGGAACRRSTAPRSSSPAPRPTGRWRRRWRAACAARPIDLTGKLGVRETMAVIAAARPLPLARHRAHAHGLRGRHAVGQRVRAVRSRALLLGRQRRRRHASRGRAARAVVRALQPHPQAARRVRGAGAARVPARGGGRRGVRGGRARCSQAGGAAREVARLLGRTTAGAARRRARAYVRWTRRAAPTARDAADEAAMAWTKAWGRRPWRDGRSLRELLVWKGVSLWWFAELYLHHSTEAPRTCARSRRAARVLRARAAGRGRGGRARARGDALLVARACAARGSAVPRAGRPARRGAGSRAGLLDEPPQHARRPSSPRAEGGARGPPRRGPRTRTAGDPCSSCRTPRSGRSARDPDTSEPEAYEHYFDRLIPAVARASRAGSAAVLAVGPRHALPPARARRPAARLAPPARRTRVRTCTSNRFTSARVLREVRQAHARGRARSGASCARAPARVEAFCASRRALRRPGRRRTSRGPCCCSSRGRCARVRGDARGARRTSARDAVVPVRGVQRLGPGGARSPAAQAGVPTVAVQHGIVYPKYFSYRHEPDEADCPRPDRTAVFGEAARRLLIDARRLRAREPGAHRQPAVRRPAARPRARGTGTRRARAAGRRGRTSAWSWSPAASAPSATPTSRSAARSPACVRAVEALPGVARDREAAPRREPRGAYEAVLRAAGARRASSSLPARTCSQLLHAADALVTVESLSAVEALVLGRPVLVLNMPTHLRDLVASGRGPGRAPRAATRGPALRGRPVDRGGARAASTAARDALPRRSWRWASTAAPPRASSRSCATTARPPAHGSVEGVT